MKLHGLAFAFALAACGTSAPQQPEGSEGGACHPNGSCDEGLECQAGICHAAGLPDAPTQPAADARASTDARAADAPPRADAGPGQPDAAPGQADAPPRPDAPPLPPDAAVPSTGELSLTWSITFNDAPATCDGVGATSVQVVATPTGGGDAITSRFDCAAGAGTTGELAAGSYDVAAHLLDDTDAVVADASVADPVSVVGGITTPAGGVIFAVTGSTTGTVSLDWTIHIGDSPTTCADAGAGLVEIFVHTNPGGPIYFKNFACSDLSGMSMDLPVGHYSDVIVFLYDIFGDPLTQVDLDAVTVTSGGDTDMGTARFLIPSPSGSFDIEWTIFQDDAPATCADVGADSAEVFAVAHKDGATTVDFYTCDEGFGITDLVAPDDYDIVVRLLDVAGGELQEQGPTTVTLHAGGLPEVDFLFTF